jgi:activator of HSP90 ATPase
MVGVMIELDMVPIKLRFRVKATVEKVWGAMVKVEEMQKWGAGPAVMDDQVGREFKLWGGDVWGKNIEVIPQQRLVQEWFGGKWDKPSVVAMFLTQKPGETVIDVYHEGVPQVEREAVKDGWDRYYWGPIKKYLEDK